MPRQTKTTPTVASLTLWYENNASRLTQYNSHSEGCGHPFVKDNRDIDSALVAVIATAALGKEAVSALLMPSPLCILYSKWARLGHLVHCVA